MILATLRMVMPSEKVAEAVRILLRTAERTSVGTGCDRYRVYRDSQETNAILLEEAWNSEEELDHHLRSDDFREVLMVMEMAVEQPEIQFSTIAAVTGLERAMAARSKNSSPGAGNSYVWPEYMAKQVVRERGTERITE
jgi:quinol monooxygenase YgiN